jgi:hypothetical protein
MREVKCPTYTEDRWAMFRHRISSETCRRRQKSFYHRCHRCQNAGRLVLPETAVIPARA